MDIEKLKKLKDKCAIAGVGYTPQGRIPGRTALSFYVEAGINAIKDAGLTKEDIDGLICYRHYSPLNNEIEVTPNVVAQQLGIEPVMMTQEGGCARNQLPCAMSMIEAGFCDCVLVIYADNAASGKRTFIEEGTHAESVSYNAAFGMFTALGEYAMAARRGMHVFGTGPETWKEIAVNQRRWAHLNPRALMYQEPLDYDTYLRQPYLVEPFKRLDCCPITDGGRAYIVTSTERARDLRNPPVTIMGIGQANPSADVHQGTFLAGPTGAKRAGAVALEMAGITLDDIDACQVYDCFTYTLEITMQDYGFYPPGGARDWFRDGRTGPGGSMPVNTSGGLLSEAYFMGLIPLTEAVMQLSGRCGDRQLGPKTKTKEPEIILCSDNGGALQNHCTTILRRI
jgi:acetyl-CoA acetyltransferase